MTSMIARVLVLVLTLGAVASASQPPVPSPSVIGQKQQANSGSKTQAGAATQTTPATPTPSPGQVVPVQTQQVPANPGNQGQNETFEDWRIVLFTGVLTIVAVLQLLAMLRQNRYMRKELDEAKRSSEAAKIGADAAKAGIEFTQLQVRPYLTIEGCELRPPEKHSTHEWTVRLRFVNRGGTPAGITMLEEAHCFALTPTPERQTILEAAEGFTIREVFPQPHEYVHVVRINSGDVPAAALFTLQIYGRCIYLNRVQQRTETTDFGFSITRHQDMTVTYQGGATGEMRETMLRWRERQNQGERSFAPAFLGGSATIGVRAAVSRPKTAKDD